MTARPAPVRSTPSDIVRMFEAAEGHDDFMRASSALSKIPSAMMTDDDRRHGAPAQVPGLTATGGKS
jgi:hypothetical protein